MSTTNESFTEKRSHIRHTFNYPLTLHVSEYEKTHASLINISLSGAMVYCALPIEHSVKSDTSLFISFDFLKNRRPTHVTIHSEWVHSRSAHTQNTEGFYHGLKFLNASLHVHDLEPFLQEVSFTFCIF